MSVALQSAEKAAEVVDRRMKPGRKKSVAEGDGGDAAPAANVKVRQQTRATPCVIVSSHDFDSSVDWCGSTFVCVAFQSAEKPAEVVDRRMKTMRKKSVAEGDGACDGSEAAAPSVKVGAWRDHSGKRPLRSNSQMYFFRFIY